jgi:cytoskeletal protein RodZ
VVDVSGRLRAAREGAGLTIEEVSARTKINATFLRAIERGEFDRLPGAFFARAFLKTYARELHLPPDEIVAAYDARFLPAPDGLDGGATTAALERTVSGHGVESSRPLIAATGGAWPLAILVAAVLVVVSVMNRPTSGGSNEPRPTGTTGVADATAAPSPAPPAPAAPEKLTIEIRPSRTIWVAGEADGLRVVYRLVEPGERVRAEARNELWFRVGDAGGFDYSINGSPGKPVGGSGEVREFRITRENVGSFHR